jgi:hypothetical protein
MASQVGVIMTSNIPPCVYVCDVSSKWVSILCINVEHDVYGGPVAERYVVTPHFYLLTHCDVLIFHYSLVWI